MEFDEAGRMKPSAYYDRVMEERIKFTSLVRGRENCLVDRYSERKESAEALSTGVSEYSGFPVFERQQYGRLEGFICPHSTTELAPVRGSDTSP
ncbi:hypothetical protein BK660_05540 [Pseudomonas brassicacearum]|uniref:Uncharacterized protein n=1 Tax=Pseudomonas brassicacearum TaxID=930166 RepID=A0A423II60_9PSED|nr:hypothetical protein BK660_05540 [Pseudomonas brassicacearum]